MAPTRNCTIGIAAHDEERSIGVLLRSLRVSEFPPGWNFRIIVAANGCTDRTVPEALRFGEKHWGAATQDSTSALQTWRFGAPPSAYSVFCMPVAQKSRALNLIHAEALDGIVLLIDGDVEVSPGFVARMCQAFEHDRSPAAVAPRYRGLIAPVSPARNSVAEMLRVTLCRTFNHFDDRLPRLDGKALGYRREIIDRHPPIISVDLWLEAHAAKAPGGCLYLEPPPMVLYRFAATLRELITQYRRYGSSIRSLARREPDALAVIHAERRRSPRRSPRVWRRLVAWPFLHIVCGPLFDPPDRFEEERWTTIPSTKNTSRG